MISWVGLANGGIHRLARVGGRNGDEVFVYHTNPNNPDEDSDGMTDGWEILHFGDLVQTESGDYDNDGVDNGTEFIAGTNPNTLWFDTHYSNLYVSNRVVNGNCEIRRGHPSQMALLIDNTNLTVASWTTYNSNFSVILPDADGAHTVLVALRGLTTNFPPVWDETDLTLDRVSPVVVFTNPAVANATVIKPYLQLQGYANEPLVALSYDLTNATGLLTNEMAAVVDQYFDTNAFDFTTNFFQAYDVELTNGLNEITLTVSDRAGNVTVTNVAVTLDCTTATNPPTMQLLWPTNGMRVSGDSFYLRGLISDETAQVLAQWVDSAGVTNELAGLVERNQMFWVEGLQLADGTNEFMLSATDAAGNVSSTNLSVVKSSVTLTITSTPTGESLYAPSGTVNGTVSGPSYAVSVNGVAANVDEYGNWVAENVPVIGQGTATFDALATGGGSAPSAAASSAVEMPANIEIVEHTVSKSTSSNDGQGHSDSFGRGKGVTTTVQAGPSGNWLTSVRGNCTDFSQNNSGWAKNIYQWSNTNRSTHYTDSSGSDTTTQVIVEDFNMVTRVPDVDVSEPGWGGGMGGEGAYPPIFLYHYYANGVRYKWPYGEGGWKKADVKARTKMMLYTGGKAGVGRKSLIHITGSAAEYGRAPDQPWEHTPITQVDASKIKVLGWWLFGRHLDPNGDLYLALPDNAVKDLNMRVPGAKHYDARASVSRHKFVHETWCPALMDTNLTRTQLGVGEYVSIRFVPGDFPTNAAWTVTAGGVDSATGNNVWYTAPSNAASASVTADVAGTAKFKVKFKVKEPNGVDESLTLVVDYLNSSPPRVAVGMLLRVFVKPTDVSFGRLSFLEQPPSPSGLEGYFGDSRYYPNPDVQLQDQLAGNWFGLDCDNSWTDKCFWDDGNLPPVLYAGKFRWPFHLRWCITEEANPEDKNGRGLVANYQQSFEVNDNGDMTVEKFGKKAIRSMNELESRNANP